MVRREGVQPSDTYWRCDVPARALGAKVCKIPIDTGLDQLLEPGLTADREFRWHETPSGAGYPDHQGSAVFVRPDQARATHALAMQMQGVRTVAEVDDNYLAPVHQNAHMAAKWGPEMPLKHLKAFACFDAIIFTTAWLRDAYAKQLRKQLRHLSELHVCGNHVDPDDWPTPAPPSSRIRVGWMGGPSHQWDLQLAEKALRWAADDPRCEVVIIGYDPEWDFDYQIIPWVDPAKFGRPTIGWPLDIALAPLRHDRFCMGKSDVKFLEYAMSGAATVASSTVYGQTVRHGETGLVASSPDAFTDAVRRLVRDRCAREQLAANAADYVRSERLIGDHTDEWREAISGR